jgi:hypothetical protein
VGAVRDILVEGQSPAAGRAEVGEGGQFNDKFAGAHGNHLPGCFEVGALDDPFDLAGDRGENGFFLFHNGNIKQFLTGGDQIAAFDIDDTQVAD